MKELTFTDFRVRRVGAKDTYGFLLKIHYAKRIPSISQSFGLFREKQLAGVCTYGKPPSNALCIGVCGEEQSFRVYELNRLCLLENLPKNTASWFLARTFKLMHGGIICVSYADTSQNHIGYIYQATNWIYTGLSAKRTERYDPDNPNKHSKTVTENKYLKYENLAVRDRPQKHRYVKFIGDKKFQKEMKSLLRYKILPYPKGESKKYNINDNSLERQAFLF